GKTKSNIEKIITGEYDENIKDRVREKAIHLTEQEHFQGLQLWLASYIVYGASTAGKWNCVNDLDKYLQEFKQHSLRNPIVEQVVTETLRVIADIWKHYGEGTKDFFSEIHVELGREMKLPSEDRKRRTTQILDNENTNLRIKALLSEMLHDPKVENVRPYSPVQQEILKIYEEYAINSEEKYNSSTGDFEYDPVSEEILKISKTAQPSPAQLRRYKLWLEQRYRSPYTGAVIPLNRLFTADYEIEHIIPQSRYFDDSFSNKVICESAVNKLKDNQTGLEFIRNHHSETVEVGFGKTVKIFEEEAYQRFVKDNYAKNGPKRNKLLMDEIPEKMIERQMNDTRYISKFISSVLSNIVRSESNDDGINSKNIVPLSGKITARLKQDWGLNDVWNDLILPRFERMNELTGSKDFTAYNERYQKYLPTVPIEFSRNFQKKRIDHRHHAMDALIIACATRNHVNFLNNQHALDKKKTKEEKDKTRLGLRNKLCYKKNGDGKGNYNWQFYKPWDNFTVDARNELGKIIVSFKQNLRVINRTVNHYERIVDGKKTTVSQEGVNWAIRKPMHKDTVSGLVRLRKTKTVSLNVAIDNYLDIVDKNLRKHLISLVSQKYDRKTIVKYFKDRENQWNGVDIKKVAIYYWENDNVASRVNIDTSFNEKRIIDTITDTGIQTILLNHLENYKGRLDDKGKEIAPESLAFTPEGIDEMNKNIISLNNGKFHQPIFKVRTYEPKGNKFNVGYTGNKKTKYVEAAKGTNLFFAIYVDDEGKRSYETIPLNIVIERLKQGLKEVPERNEKEHHLLFHLSPNDLVYVPLGEESTISTNYQLKGNRIYKMVSSTGNRCFFIKNEVAISIVDKVEYSALNKMERSI
ncbi:MAG: type II CRISPR RNA-guided endonuclease Cas9, partial [Tannerella sp.]|nr:type II CRISPR RNA-guided endonuclease Cas9 [Tannerella sp.]